MLYGQDHHFSRAGQAPCRLTALSLPLEACHVHAISVGLGDGRVVLGDVPAAGGGKECPMRPSVPGGRSGRGGEDSRGVGQVVEAGASDPAKHGSRQ